MVMCTSLENIIRSKCSLCIAPCADWIMYKRMCEVKLASFLMSILIMNLTRVMNTWLYGIYIQVTSFTPEYCIYHYRICR
ncbi:hypothetical protein GDO81_009981 [Engystomops pustulosus]|uniref:Uncharacterized protein n=1 Tax=Engystomops pustulosus TaxID=76066 RepID=A0AAV7BWN6_ENGPU|nr:hypothetical protein GDO81_009981 [Engystomops pustulosus]